MANDTVRLPRAKFTSALLPSAINVLRKVGVKSAQRSLIVASSPTTKAASKSVSPVIYVEVDGALARTEVERVVAC